jgi:hypothetical protein
MEETIKINWKDKEEEVIIASLTYGEYKEIRRKSISHRAVDGNVTSVRDIDLHDELCVLKSIKKAPFDVSLDNIRQLSKADGEIIEEVVNRLNFPSSNGTA